MDSARAVSGYDKQAGMAMLERLDCLSTARDLAALLIWKTKLTFRFALSNRTFRL